MLTPLIFFFPELSEADTPIVSAATPSHVYTLHGAATSPYILVGPNTAPYDLAGPNTEPYTL